MRLFDLDSERERENINDFIKENPEFFSPCPGCPAARDCLMSFQRKVPINRSSKNRYFKKWIERCVKTSQVKSRQDFLSLADRWTVYSYRTKRRSSYRFTVGKCLDEVVDNSRSGVRMIERNRTFYYYSYVLTEKEVENLVREEVALTRERRRVGSKIGDCLIDIVAEYFKHNGVDVRTKVPVDSGREDIDVLTDEYMIEVRNHAQPIDIGGLRRVLKKFKKWMERGYNRQKVLVCNEMLGNKAKERCAIEDIILIEVRFQVVPAYIRERIKVGVSDNIAARWVIWNKIRKGLKRTARDGKIGVIDVVG